MENNSKTFEGSLLHCLGSEGGECDDTSGPRLTKVEYEEGTKDITLHFNEFIIIDESVKEFSEINQIDVSNNFTISGNQVIKIKYDENDIITKKNENDEEEKEIRAKKIILELTENVKIINDMEIEYKKISIIIKDLSNNEMSTFKRKITKKTNL